MYLQALMSMDILLWLPLEWCTGTSVLVMLFLLIHLSRAYLYNMSLKDKLQNGSANQRVGRRVVGDVIVLGLVIKTMENVAATKPTNKYILNRLCLYSKSDRNNRTGHFPYFRKSDTGYYSSFIYLCIRLIRITMKDTFLFG